MSVQYQRIPGDASFSSGSPDFQDDAKMTFMENRPVVRRPFVLGFMQIVVGMLISFLGLFESFILPLMDDEDGSMKFNKSTCYGVGLYAGLLLLLAGSLAVRASTSKRRTTMHQFYHVTCLTLLGYIALTLALVVLYYQGWNNKYMYPVDSHRSQVHAAMVVLVMVGMALALSSLLLFYDLVCCGEGQLWYWWTHCLCDVFSTQSQNPRSLQAELNGQSATPPLLI